LNKFLKTHVIPKSIKEESNLKHKIELDNLQKEAILIEDMG
jgi:hypothetical protein